MFFSTLMPLTLLYRAVSRWLHYPHSHTTRTPAALSGAQCMVGTWSVPSPNYRLSGPTGGLPQVGGSPWFGARPPVARCTAGRTGNARADAARSSRPSRVASRVEGLRRECDRSLRAAHAPHFARRRCRSSRVRVIIGARRLRRARREAPVPPLRYPHYWDTRYTQRGSVYGGYMVGPLP